jgi:S1-C subfamily serine protease
MTETETSGRAGATRRAIRSIVPGVLVASLALGAGAVITGTGRGQVGPGAGAASEPAVELHRKVARSTAWVISSRGFGTGWLVDAGQGYLVTARHVVADGTNVEKQVQVLFAQFDGDGQVITDRSYYDKNKERLSIRATVVYESLRRDMAVLKLERVPAGVPALPLAARAPRPGQAVHLVGNSSVRHGGLFGYCRGAVRNVFRFDPPGNPILAEVVAHHVPTNQGDSGGAVVNNQGEVVAFISQGTTGGMPTGGWTDNQQVLDHSICVTEIRLGLQALRAAAANPR